nr:MAG TPA: hypothetical protein [Caudoviricetes sp.]
MAIIIEEGTPLYEKYRAERENAGIESAEVPSPNNQEEVSVDVAPENEEGTSLLEQAAGGFIEGSKALANGAIKSAQATLDLSASAADFASQVWNKGWNAADFKEVDSPIQIPTFDIQGAAPEFVEGASQFMFSLAGVNKATPFLNAYRGAGKLASWGTEFIRGGVADIVGMKADEENLTASLIEAFPSLEDSILSYVANDGKSDAIEGRLRNALEGMGLGVAVDLGMAGTGKAVDMVMDYLKTARATRKAASSEELKAALKEEGLVVDEVKPEVEEMKPDASDTPPVETSSDVPDKTAETPAAEVKDSPVEESPIQHLQGTTPQEKVSTLISEVDTGKRDYKLLTSDERNDLLTAVRDDPKSFEKLSENINWNTYAYTDPDGKKLLAGMANALAEKKALMSGTTESFADVGKRAALVDELYGTDVQKLADALYQATGSIRAAEAVRAQVASVLPAMTRQATVLAAKFMDSTSPVLWTDRMEFVRVFNDIQKLWIADKDIGTASGRLLNSRKYTGGPVKEGLEEAVEKNPDDLIDIFNLFDEVPSNMRTEDEFWDWCKSMNISQESFDKAVEAVYRTQGDPAKMFKQMKALKQGSWSQLGVYWFTQNILTSPVTHIWNIAGNVTKLTSQATGHLLVSGAKALFKEGGKEDLLESIRFMGGLYHSIGTAFQLALSNAPNARRIASKSYSRNSSKFLEGSLMGDEAPASFEYVKRLFTKGDDTMELSWEQNLLAHFIHYAGTFARVNSRLMAGEDEFFKQLVFQARQYASISRQLDEQNIFDAAKRKEEFNKLADRWFTDDGLVNMNNPGAAEALRMAEYTTYSQDVTTQWVRAINDASNRSPVLKVLMPFVKTVWNVQIDALEHTPFAFLSKQWRNDWSAKGWSREEALGRAAVGTMFMVYAYQLCDEGIITGALSEDKSKREAQTRAGIRPYSIKIGDTYIPYDRLDPLGTLLGIVADTTTIIKNATDAESTGAEVEGVPEAVLGAFFRTMTNKSFLSSMTDFFKVFDSQRDPGSQLMQFSWNTGKAFMPGSGLFRASANAVTGLRGESYERPDTVASYLGDIDMFRLANSLAVRAKNIPLRYDWFTGDTYGFRGYFYTESNKDWVIREMEKIGYSTYGAPERSLAKGVRLSSEQYSRLCQLHGTLKLNGKTLKEAVQDLMESPQYDIEGETYTYTPEGESKSRRGTLVNRIISRYRDAAKKKLMEEYPELKQALSEAKARERASKRGQKYYEFSSDGTRSTGGSSWGERQAELLRQSLAGGG